MKTFKRKCIQSFKAGYNDINQNEFIFEVEKDKYYITSDKANGYLLVFTNRWFVSEASLFDEGEQVL